MPAYNAVWGQYACIRCCFGAICQHVRLFCHAASWTGTVLWFTSSELGKEADIQVAMVWVQPEESLAAVVVAFPGRMLWGSPHVL